jgi:hypothetical protein
MSYFCTILHELNYNIFQKWEVLLIPIHSSRKKLFSFFPLISKRPELVEIDFSQRSQALKYFLNFVTRVFRNNDLGRYYDVVLLKATKKSKSGQLELEAYHEEAQHKAIQHHKFPPPHHLRFQPSGSGGAQDEPAISSPPLPPPASAVSHTPPWLHRSRRPSSPLLP